MRGVKWATDDERQAAKKATYRQWRDKKKKDPVWVARQQTLDKISYQKHGAKQRAFQLTDTYKRLRTMRRYRLTSLEYDQLLKVHACPICGGTVRDIDHCHKTGKVRGRLCGSCNRGLGSFKDSPVLLKSAIGYLAANGKVYKG